jgi:hypothetical protein
MSCRVDTSSLISGACVVGDRGHGVLASTVPSTGTHGPSFLYRHLELPADNAKEVRGLVTTPPAAGVFFANEDGSFTLTGAGDGAHPFTYSLIVDGAVIGSQTADILVGDATATVTGAGGIASGEAFGVASFARIVGGAAVTDAGGIPSGEAFGLPVLTVSGGTAIVVDAGGIPSGEAFGMPTATFVAGNDVFSGVVTRNRIGRSPLRP